MSRPISQQDVRVLLDSLGVAERETKHLGLPDHDTNRAAPIEHELQTALTLLDNIHAAPVADDYEFLAGLYLCKYCVEKEYRFARKDPECKVPSDKPRRGWDKFQHHSSTQTPFKFPPIGFGKRPLMFIAINPRLTNNRQHYVEIMSSLDKFKALSRNEVFGSHYIRSPSAVTGSNRESFYDDQQKIAAVAFPNMPFVDVACSAEMYFCASENGDGLACDHSPCAQKYLRRLIEDYVQPDLIVTFGNRIPFFFENHLIGIAPKVMPLPFRSYNSAKTATMDTAVTWAGNAADAFFHGRPIPPKNWSWPRGQEGRPDPIMDYSRR
jgi:hypothetical protein